MAIGDAVAAFLGPGSVTRQPAAGVEERITAIVKDRTTDRLTTSGGGQDLNIMDAAIDLAATAGGPNSGYLTGIMIDNSFFLAKTGTTDGIGVFGVQTNA